MFWWIYFELLVFTGYHSVVDIRAANIGWQRGVSNANVLLNTLARLT